MFIRTETTPNPDSMKFIPDKMLLEPGQSMNFPNAVAAVRSPLAKMLFRNEMVQGVFIGSTFVTVTKDEDSEWDEVKSIVFADLMEFLSSGEPVLLGEMPVSDTTILPDDSEDVALIKTLIETRIRPSIQDDGGDVIFKGFIDGVVFLQLQGACTSCSSSSVTLKNGVEKMLKHWSSSVISVVAIESEEEWERIRSGQPAASTSEASSGSSTNTDKPSSPENESFNANQNKSAKVEDL
jgi:Fe-S cluster biogenesis protein NfuA